jgi:hypothetical protein
MHRPGIEAYGRLLTDPPNRESNCIGYALSRFVPGQPDVYVQPPRLRKLFGLGFCYAKDQPPQALAVIFSPLSDLLICDVDHIAVVCRHDPSRVRQRDDSWSSGCFHVRELPVTDFQKYYGEMKGGLIVPLRYVKPSV